MKVKFQNIYLLKFLFQLKPELFGETVNPEQKVDIGQKEIKFNGPPKEQFFFSNLTGGENVDPGWELITLKYQLLNEYSLIISYKFINLVIIIIQEKKMHKND